MNAVRVFRNIHQKHDLHLLADGEKGFTLNNRKILLSELSLDLWSTSTIDIFEMHEVPSIVIIYKVAQLVDTDRLFFVWTEVVQEQLELLKSSRPSMKLVATPPFCKSLSHWLGGPRRAGVKPASDQESRWNIVGLTSKHASESVMRALRETAQLVHTTPPWVNLP